MTITAPHPLALDFGAGFEGVGTFLRDHQDVAARLRFARHVSIPLDGSTNEERMDDLRAVAVMLGVTEQWHGRCWSASLPFGPVSLEAHHDLDSIYRIQDAARRSAA